MINVPKLDDKMWVPLGFAISVIGGAGYWLASVDAKAQAQAASLSEQRVKIERVTEYMESIDRRLSNIEGTLDGLKKVQRRK